MGDSNGLSSWVLGPCLPPGLNHFGGSSLPKRNAQNFLDPEDKQGLKTQPESPLHSSPTLR